MRPIEIRRGNTIVLIGRAGSFPEALLVADDNQRRDAFLVNLPQERAALEQIRREWTNVFPATTPEQLSGTEIVRTVRRAVRSGAVRVVLLRTPRMPVAPAAIQQVSSGLVNAGTAQQRLLIARVGGLPPEYMPYRNPARAIAVLGQLGDSSPTARQIDLQAGRLRADGRSALHGKPLRQNLVWQINAGSLEAAVIAHAPAVATARSRADAPRHVMDMDNGEKIAAALQRAVPRLEGEVRAVAEQMIEPENLAIMAGVFVIVAAAQLTPLTGAAVNSTLVAVAWYTAGLTGIIALGQFIDTTITAITASSEKELDEAGETYAKALVALGAMLLQALMAKFVAKKGGKNEPAGSPAKPAKAPGKATSSNAQQKNQNVRESQIKPIPPATVGRTVYRGDGRSPDTIFKEGFNPKGTSTNLKDYVDNNTSSAFVGTSKEAAEAGEFARRNGGFVYQVDGSRIKGIDVNDAYPANPFASEREIAVLGGIPKEAIVSARKAMPDGTLGPVIPNPLYKGPL